MKLLVKVGGTLLDSPDTRAQVAHQIAEISRRGVAVAVVHGGGRQMTRFLEERGIASRFVNGLRVTTPETMDALLKVLAGSVNQELVAALVHEGVSAAGLSGADGNLIEAEQMDPALGQVGRVVRANAGLLDLLANAGHVPVVACVAGDRQGNLYNVNADQMASACAAAYGARLLVFLTDVEGVRDGSGQVRSALSVEECERLIAEGIATGGMQAKLTAAAAALNQGVERVIIASGTAPGVLETALRGDPPGTVLSAGEPSRKFVATRKAAMKDIQPILQLVNAWASQGIMLPRTEFDLSENLRDFSVCYSGDRLIGCGALHFYTPRTGEIRSLAVQETEHGKGAGRRLVDALIAEARLYRLDSVFVFTYLPEFFRKSGFHEVERGELPLKVWKDCLRCPKFECCDEIAMIRWLNS